MGTYSLERPDSGMELARFTVRSEKGWVYVYQRWSDDRWEVRKLTVDQIEAAVAVGMSGDALLASVDVTYRITEGRCTCPGYGYRHSCQHMDEVKARRSA